jgi:hypothetical protein
MEELKQKYNRKLKIYRTLEKFIDKADTPESIKDIKMPEAEKLLTELSKLLWQVGDHSQKEAEHGF